MSGCPEDADKTAAFFSSPLKQNTTSAWDEQIKRWKEKYGEDLICKGKTCPICKCYDFPLSMGGEICPPCDMGKPCRFEGVRWGSYEKVRK